MMMSIFLIIMLHIELGLMYVRVSPVIAPLRGRLRYARRANATGTPP